MIAFGRSRPVMSHTDAMSAGEGWIPVVVMPSVHFLYQRLAQVVHCWSREWLVLLQEIWRHVHVCAEQRSSTARLCATSVDKQSAHQTIHPHVPDSAPHAYGREMVKGRIFEHCTIVYTQSDCITLPTSVTEPCRDNYAASMCSWIHWVSEESSDPHVPQAPSRCTARWLF